MAVVQQQVSCCCDYLRSFVIIKQSHLNLNHKFSVNLQEFSCVCTVSVTTEERQTITFIAGSTICHFIPYWMWSSDLDRETQICSHASDCKDFLVLRVWLQPLKSYTVSIISSRNVRQFQKNTFVLLLTDKLEKEFSRQKGRYCMKPWWNELPLGFFNGVFKGNFEYYSFLKIFSLPSEIIVWLIISPSLSSLQT